MHVLPQTARRSVDRLGVRVLIASMLLASCSFLIAFGWAPSTDGQLRVVGALLVMAGITPVYLLALLGLFRNEIGSPARDNMWMFAFACLILVSYNWQRLAMVIDFPELADAQIWLFLAFSAPVLVRGLAHAIRANKSP
jgi:hypothetical protein